MIIVWKGKRDIEEKRRYVEYKQKVKSRGERYIQGRRLKDNGKGWKKMKKRKNEIREMGKNDDGDGIDEVNWDETRRREEKVR